MDNVILHTLLSLSFSERGPPPPSPIHSSSEVCFDPYGCFSLDPPWAGTTERPVAVLPMPLSVTTPVFCFHSTENPSCQELSLQNIGELYTSSLDKTAPLYFITHGYMETAALDWMVDMRDTLLKVSPTVGVVTVDWSKAAHPPYAQAVANIRLSGAITGYLLHLLVEFYDVPLSNIHLIGHSLGAHFMSYAGDYVKNTTQQKVGRITGLDPAGPYFVNTPPMVRLDPNDGQFVDVIHTDIPDESWEINKLGNPDPLGHVDYYPNGGSNQAGCDTSAHARVKKEKSIADGVFSYIGCSHQRSHVFFIESILSKCKFLGIACNSWKDFLQGKCWGCSNGKCDTMGFYASHLSQRQNRDILRSLIYEDTQNDIEKYPITNFRNKTGLNTNDTNTEVSHSSNSAELPIKIFMGTNSKSPFCAEQYRITVVTSDSPMSQESGGDVARFTFMLRGTNGELKIHPSAKSTFIEPGGRYSQIGFSSDLGSLIALQVDYEEDQGLLHALIWRFNSPSLFIDSFIVDELSTSKRTVFEFCDSRMEAGYSLVLFPDKLCAQTTNTTDMI